MPVFKAEKEVDERMQVEGMVMCRRMEAERSKFRVGDGKISMPVAASPYTGVTKKPG